MRPYPESFVFEPGHLKGGGNYLVFARGDFDVMAEKPGIIEWIQAAGAEVVAQDETGVYCRLWVIHPYRAGEVEAIVERALRVADECDVAIKFIARKTFKMQRPHFQAGNPKTLTPME